jgi:hypothetical protein
LALCAGLVYALLLNALIAGAFNAQAIAAELDPLAAAATCDSTGSDPVQHSNQHQPDCTLCGPACSMASPVLALGGGFVFHADAPSSTILDVSARAVASFNPPSVYRSDTAAQAPPAIG